MIENERFEERFLSMRLRGLLGEKLFWQIAHVNPMRWLENEKVMLRFDDKSGVSVV